MELYLKLEEEFQALNTKIMKLESFMETESYEALTVAHQQLLYCQFEAMRTYGSLLVSRMKLIMEECDMTAKPRTEIQQVIVPISECNIENFKDLVYNNSEFDWDFPDQNGNMINVHFVREMEDGSL